LKKQLYITLILPVILYGAETRPLRKLDDRKFVLLGKKMLQKIFGPVKGCNSGKRRRRKTYWT